MGRYRAPLPKSSPYITPQGHQALTEELQSIWKRRAIVTIALSAAAAEGDRSENAEYIYRKKELREIDRRIRYLQKRLPELKVVAETPSDTKKVFFGASVTLENDAGKRVCYRIVGSIDSPMAQALMKKSLNDEIRVTTPGGQVSYIIANISYR
jgi:transcription elongation factor GreB